VVVGTGALDVVNGFIRTIGLASDIPVSPGDMGRGLLLLVAVMVMVAFRPACLSGLLKTFLILTGLIVLGPINGLFQHYSTAALQFDIVNAAKVLYGPALVILFITVFIKSTVSFKEILDAIRGWGGLVGSSLVGFKLFGVGNGTYGSYASAFKGLFIAQNDVGLGLVISVCIAAYQFSKAPKISRLCVFLLIEAGMFVLGTRVASLGAIFIPALIFLVTRPRGVRMSSGVIKAGVGVFLLLITVVLAYQVSTTVTSENYQENKFSELSQGKFTRVHLMNGALMAVKKRGTRAMLIGEGADEYQRRVAEAMHLARRRRKAEINWLDFYGSYGIIFTIGIYLFYLVALRRSLTVKLVDSPKFAWIAGLSVGVYILHGTLAGHAMSSPIPTTLVAPIIAAVWLRQYKNKTLLSTDPIAPERAIDHLRRVAFCKSS